MRPVRVHLLDNGELEECEVVDPGPSRMGACLKCGAVYLQESKLKELQMFHNVGRQRRLPAPAKLSWWKRFRRKLSRAKRS
jgi:hypothetical protein